MLYMLCGRKDVIMKVIIFLSLTAVFFFILGMWKGNGTI